MNNPGYYKTRVGAFTVTALHDGTITRDRPEGFIPNANADDVERVFRQSGFGVGQMVLSFTAFLVETPDALVLIDTGFGSGGAETTGRLGVNLKAAGYQPEDVDIVLISHFHGDHISGLLTAEGGAAYSGARVMVPRVEYQYWLSDDQMAAAPEARKGGFETCRKVFGALDGKVSVFDWGDEPVPGLTATELSGHTPGMTGFVIASENDQLYFVADVCNNPTIFARRHDWRVGFDMDGARAVETRQRVFSEVADRNTRLAFYHAPFPAIGRIVRDGGVYQYLPEVWF